MENFKVYVTDYEYASLDEEKTVLEKIGAKLIPQQCKTEEEIIQHCTDADGLLNQYAPITRKVMKALPHLKVICRYGVGVNTIDLDAATEFGICVLNVPDYGVDEVSNHAFALLIACARKLTLLHQQVQDKGWDYKISKPIYRLSGQKLGLLGFGRISRALAKKAQAFNLKLLVYDPFIKESDAASLGAKRLSLEEVLTEADFISVHVPLTKETYHMLGEKEFGMMKNTAIIINTSRGPLIDEAALAKALTHKQIAGAGLDVTEEEPLATSSPLLGQSNVIITPHVAWYSEQAEIDLKTKAAQGIADVLAGYYPAALVNQEVSPKQPLEKTPTRRL